ncbi:MAG: glycosyl hydrolase [Firmicutes bacterium]|nr:glycosyl hydrolase [Bacillota bacterium]
MRPALFFSALCLSLASGALWSAPPAASGDPLKASTFEGLALRNLGPAITSGRIGDLAIDPTHPDTWYAAVASGGVWKTVNGGITWAPIFDGEASYSIGCITLDPKRSLTVWVGTGENNSQRSVGYGDGVYKSEDGGKNWKAMGLKTSEHIAKILIDPRDSNVVYAAAQGPLWKAGGERGLYKSTDGGETWKPVLTVSEHTGVTDVLMDPRNADVLLAATYQRRRHVWTLINGGPESGLQRSTDGGKTWKKITQGLPKEDMGRIGLAYAPSRPDTMYAIVEAANKSGGFYRSTDGGLTWERRSDYVSSSPQYYQELVVDPYNPDRVYSLDTWLHVSEDGGKTFQRLGEKKKHVDNHALWIDSANTDHLIAGCDGGIYETRDRGQHWEFKPNLPVAQFYRVSTDRSKPFYYVYGGTQDNNSLGGPSRTRSKEGIANQDWFFTQGGDGFYSKVDPTDPNTVYAEAQYGDLIRYQRTTGETVDIQPQALPGEAPLRWNWDAPLIISPHAPQRLYFAAQKVFRSDDRGNSWKAVSPDLSRGLDRHKLLVMGQQWSLDAVARHTSTSVFGNITALAESPKAEGLLYVGTDDGLLQVSENGGQQWRRVERFPGVPDMAYVSRVEPSPHDANVVYVAFDHHKMGDFKPYLLRSRDRGRTFENVAGNLPERGSVRAVVEDPAKPGLLFAGTEFGLFFSLDEGRRWTQLKGHVPPIPVMDLEIQAREGDLVAATFGRGILVLDDLTPLRQLTPQALEQPGLLFTPRRADLYTPAHSGGSFGASFFTAPNPPFGAVFTYYLKNDAQSLAKARRKAEKGADNPPTPTWEALRAEALEEEPTAILTITDEAGEPVRRITGPAKAGMHRVAWDLRHPSTHPVSLKTRERDPWETGESGPFAAPGTYRVSLALRAQGTTTSLGEPQTFQVLPLGVDHLSAEVQRFHKDVARLQRAVAGSEKVVEEAEGRLKHLRKALLETPKAGPEATTKLNELAARLDGLKTELSGDALKAKYQEATVPAISERLDRLTQSAWTVTEAPTQSQRQAFETCATAFENLLPRLRALIEQDLKAFEGTLEAQGAPWTPGRMPIWTR